MIIGKYDFLVSDDCDITRFAEVSTVLKFILLGMRDPVIPFAMYREIVKMLNEKEMSENEKIESIRNDPDLMETRIRRVQHKART